MHRHVPNHESFQCSMRWIFFLVFLWRRGFGARTTPNILFKKLILPEITTAKLTIHTFSSDRRAPLSRNGRLTTYAQDSLGSPIDYFAGADTDTIGECACAKTGECSLPTAKCNCDNELDDEQVDEGYYYSDKVQLPISSFVTSSPGRYRH